MMRQGMWRIGLAVVLLAGTAGRAAAFPWDKDMRDQASVKPQESQVYNNPSSVPTHDREPFAAPADLTAKVMARLAAGNMKNPVPTSGESLNHGKELYDRHCGVCHGPQGHGDGPVGKKYVPDPMNLTIDYVQLQPDGQLFYTITHGSIAMPSYRETIPVKERWDVVNYIKAVLRQKPE